MCERNQMNINNFSPDTLKIITSFLDNKSSINLITTSQTINKHGKIHGFLTNISIGVGDFPNMMDFIKRFCEHSQCLKSVLIRGIDDPQLWIPRYTERMVFDHCSIFSYINPGKQGNITKSLVIKDYHRYKNKQTLRINWKCFPNLEELEVYTHDVDWRDAHLLKNIKRVKINTCNSKPANLFNHINMDNQ